MEKNTIKELLRDADDNWGLEDGIYQFYQLTMTTAWHVWLSKAADHFTDRYPLVEEP